MTLGRTEFAGLYAVAPGTDLSRHARDLVRMHDAVIGGSSPAIRPRPLVSRSWSRVLEAGLEPDRPTLRDPLGPEQLEGRRRASPLSDVVGELRQLVPPTADAAGFLLVVTDADGVVLWRHGAPRVRHQADTLGFAEGALWTETAVGTNAIGTALAEAAPVQLFSGEHFEAAQHPWYCTAAPVHDPRTGALLGVVDISGPALTLHPAVASLVEAACRLAQARLTWRHELRLERLRRTAEHLLATVSGPVLLVDDDGWVAHHHGIAVRDRIAAPRADRPVAVPGLGLCLPERVGDGWLVRPVGAPGRLAVVLDLTGPPVLEVTGEAAAWRTPITPRHVQVLLALQRAGRTGLSAERLSAMLYGDGEHRVSARAEVSRLRRVVGGLVETHPYRLADGLAFGVRGEDPTRAPGAAGATAGR